MIANYEQGNYVIMQAATAATIDGFVAAGIALPHKILYQGMVQDGVLAAGQPGEYWARISKRTFMQKQTAFGSSGQKRHTARGLVFVQLFLPVSKNEAWQKGQLMVSPIKKALSGRSSSGTVIFREPRAEELGLDGSHHRLNVVAEFEYDEKV